jgi:signal transduction histidine kinase/ligand-binding sensor domain-containing protein
MKFLLKLFLFVLFIIIKEESSAQTADVKFTLFSGTNGITLGKINGMTRDKYGFLWFSDQSNRCIIRFDGNHTIRYQNDPQNPNSLGGYYPECLAADSSGNIWIGFYGMGLDKFDPVANKFIHYRHNNKNPESLSNDFVSAVLVDHLGNVWAGDYGGVDLLDQGTGKFKNYSHRNNDPSSLSCDSVRALYEDKVGEIWVGTGFAFDPGNPNGGLNLFHRTNGTFTRYLHDPKDPHSLAGNKVRAILEDSYGNFWVGTNGDGLHTMDRRTGQFIRYTYSPTKPDQLSRTKPIGAFDHITFITEDADKKIWIGTLENGIIRYDPVSKRVKHYGSAEDKKRELKDKTSYWANATQDGFIWISTQNANLFKADIYNTTIPYYGESNEPDEISGSSGTYAFAEETDSVFLFGTRDGLIEKDFRSSSTHRFFNAPLDPNSLSNNDVLAILKDTFNNFWLGTASGLNYFDRKKVKFARYYPDSINKTSASNFIYKLCKDYNSNLWLGTRGGGLYMFSPTTHKFILYKNIPTDGTTISGDFISSVFVDTHDLWIGMDHNDGLNRMNLQTKKCTHYLSGLNITCIYKDADGIMWVGSSGGVYRYNKNSNSFNSTAEEHSENDLVQVESITSDKENNLWMGSETGIYMLNKKRDRVIRFGKEYGVPDANNAFFNGSSFTAQNGEIYLGNVGGYYAFFPEKLKISVSKPKLYFTGFWLDNKQILPGSTSLLKQSLYQTKEIRLNHNQNVFALSSTSVDFRDVGDKRIYYKLDSYDVDWRAAQPEDKITYFKVPPGNYTFRIRTRNGSNDDWIEKSMDVIILPPWWVRWWAYCIYGILFCVLAFAVHRYQKARVIKAEREKARVKELAQAKEIERAYTELKSTQAQLIQSEKMASLGELTAGIAHEIQNPLNFVNNFSEVSNELVDEMEEALQQDDNREAVAIASDIKDNLRKIRYHGKRADAIVKGMLQHSRASTGKKEPTDINALADEYLRLSFHGLRAKDKDFNASFTTNFDDSIGKIEVAPQDIGRVLLNLYNNAFYSVNEKKKQLNETFEPTVEVTTRRHNSMIEISVKDNGIGIPQKAVDKIYQPFFTTKPTGKGTGLGLSLSYDIITKGHGGQLRVDTKEGEYAKFVVQLPVE